MRLRAVRRRQTNVLLTRLRRTVVWVVTSVGVHCTASPFLALMRSGAGTCLHAESVLLPVGQTLPENVERQPLQRATEREKSTIRALSICREKYDGLCALKPLG
jgi:hypothetical protein